MNTYYGIFKDLHRLLGTQCRDSDLYEERFASLYDAALANEEECAIYLAEAGNCGRRVLELCCGNGRLTTVFARYGFDITGVDSSADMLRLLEEKKQLLPKRISSRIQTKQCDVFAANWDGTYDFIFLPATTLCLLCDDLNATAKLFCSLSDVLDDNGSFMFDIRIYDEDSRGSSPLLSLSPSTDQCERVLFYQDHFDAVPGYDVANFFLIEKTLGKPAQFYLSASVKRILREADIEALVAKTPFYVARTEARILNGYQVRFFTLKKRKPETESALKQGMERR